ncbi:LysR family transcriptional regulator [Marinomonas sp. SBI22]|uniref:LysR family transcriptional regulator n=1 Tax=unclassified Marinomonas TaxID=196814 RepID=UPI0007AF3A6F|nr:MULTISPECIES: LysR family transcriptional regulator [unclassified Marinomonas]KZM42151.1 LysR family transcriptional regulator [Marinomonas sp. SBI22]KZM47005.1 LysR family transcriptional regulator [Marinomonas sp. SBI8L]
MAKIDLNLLIALNVLLEEASVVRAAKRLGLSQSAMSRSLARLRDVTGDPLLVRAGRTLIPSPRALEIQQEVSQLVSGAKAILRPSEMLDLNQLDRRFVIRVSDGFVETFGLKLIQKIKDEAKGVKIHFLPKLSKQSTQLREGQVDLDIGVLGAKTSPEVRMRALFSDEFVGVVSPDHILAKGKVTCTSFAAADHVLVSKEGGLVGPVDKALEAMGYQRNITVLTGGFSASIALVKGDDLVASVPSKHTAKLREGLHTFKLPFDVPSIQVSMFWHPRMDGDHAHKWLRECVLAVCGDEV